VILYVYCELGIVLLFGGMDFVNESLYRNNVDTFKYSQFEVQYLVGIRTHDLGFDNSKIKFEFLSNKPKKVY
jgi:hypothetical protein